MRIVERAEHARGQAREMWRLRASLLLQLCPHDMWESHALLSSSERQSSHLNHGHGSPSFRAGCPLQPVDITSPGTALVTTVSVDHPACLCGPSWWRGRGAPLVMCTPPVQGAEFICPAGGPGEGSCLQGQAD